MGASPFSVWCRALALTRLPALTLTPALVLTRTFDADTETGGRRPRRDAAATRRYFFTGFTGAFVFVPLSRYR